MTVTLQQAKKEIMYGVPCYVAACRYERSRGKWIEQDVSSRSSKRMDPHFSLVDVSESLSQSRRVRR